MKHNHQSNGSLKLLCILSLTLSASVLAAQSPNINLSTFTLTFATQNIGTTSTSQSVGVTNSGTAAVALTRILVSGNFSGDFAQSNNCGPSLAAGSSCSVTVTFTPSGTGRHTALLLLIDNAPNSPQTVALAGTGAGGCANISDCAFQELNRRATENQNSFFVYKDADSALNHGIPSGVFGSTDVNLSSVVLDPACIDDPSADTLATKGCSADATRLDGTRGNVFRITFPPLPADDFVGVNFTEPQNYDGINVVGNGYNLTPATAVQFEVRSPDGATVQFGVGGCITNFFTLGPAWTTLRIPINTLFPPSGGAFPCPPDLSSTHILFTVATNGVQFQNKTGTVLLDNIQFVPVPTRQSSDPQSLSLPLGNQTLGVKPQNAQPFPTDQANRASATIYEGALTVLSLLQRGQPADVANALRMADALDYALHHDNHGDSLPVAPDGSVGLHNGYSSGDIALLNNQPSQGAGVPVGLAGDVRLAGFSIAAGTTLCGTTAFCLLEDGATGGNNAFAVLALAAAYMQSGNQTYLTDAETIGNWVIGTLKDPDSTSFGGYFAQLDDLIPHRLNHGKSTENNADIFAAFSLLAQIEAARGNSAAAANWNSQAKAAGDFVMQMFDAANGRFFVGTIPAGSSGSCPNGLQKSSDVINTCDFLDSDSFTTLAMAAAPAYRNAIDWTRPLQYVLNLPAPSSFTQSVMANGITFQGFDIVPAAPSTGVAWEFTGQVVEACNYLDVLLNITTFQACAQTYLAQISSAQNSAPFGNGSGVVASTLQNGDSLNPVNQCLNTPFQCIPERTGLAATNWAIYADRKFNPLGFAVAVFSPKNVIFPSQLVNTTSAATTVTLTNIGIIPLAFTGTVMIGGANSADFAITSNSCLNGVALAPGATCAVGVAFTPSAGGVRSGALIFSNNGIGSPQAVNLSGTGLPLNDFSLMVSPSSQTVVAGQSASYTVSTAVTRGNSQSVILSVSNPPNGVTPSFFPNPIASGNSSTLTLTVDPGTAPLSQILTVVGSGASSVQSAMATLNVQAPVTLSPTALVFPLQAIGTTSSTQAVVVTNNGVATSVIRKIVISGTFNGDYAQSNNCGAGLAAGASCTINVSFSPSGTGTRSASLLIIDNAGNSPQTVVLTGTGKGTCTNISDCAYAEITRRVNANQGNFYVYLDGDSGFNHGFPSGLFGTFDLSTIIIDSGCVDDPISSTGCTSDPTRMDGTRGTVFRISFPPMSSQQFAGLNFQEPQFFDGRTGNSYNLSPATMVQFDVRSPDAAKVTFGVGGCVSNPIQLTTSWATLQLSINSLTGTSCPPDLTRTHLLFAIQANGNDSPNGATVLLDNIQFLPVPARQANDSLALSLPASTATFGALPSLNFPVPIDQVTRNLSTVYESALTILALLKRGDTTNAGKVANALDYALHHDNHGDAVPVLGDGSVGLHNGYSSGDLGLLNNQGANQGLAGDIRLAGFSAGTPLCGATGFCLVLDGASGGSNAWAILSFGAAYLQTGNLTYLTDAETIGSWINGKLLDSSQLSYGGYFLGYQDGGIPGVFISGKSTEFNADIYAAFSLLAQIEAGRGNSAASATWTTRANVAGDFVMQMFDSAHGRFFAGTVSSDIAGSIGPGICANGPQRGNDVINTCDFLDADSFTALALAGSSRYQTIDWTRPLSYVLNLSSPGSFSQSVVAGGVTFNGFDLIPSPAATGVAWEFTGQMAQACNFVDDLLNVTTFQTCATTYITELLQAQNRAPFGDGLGITGSTLQAGDTLPPISQCLNTPFQCVPERPTLAATNWAIYADQKLNPFAVAAVALSPSALNFPGQPVNSTSAPLQITVTNTGTGKLKTSAVAISGSSAAEFTKTSDTCSGASVAAGASCSIKVAFTPAVSGTRLATLTLSDNALGNSQSVALSGVGVPSFNLSVTPQGTGTGTVTSNDGSINCGTTCSANLASGAIVTLTAVPATGSAFTGWSGACSGAQTCTVTMNSSQTVFAIFSSVLGFVPVTPCRIADTRNANGPFGGPFLTGGTRRSFAIPSSACGIPATAQAYSFNATVVPHGVLGFLTMYPSCDQAPPLVSTVNSDGRIKAGATIVPAAANGSVCAFASDDTDLILDINGYFVSATNTSALAFYPLPPCRVVDTRLATGSLGGPSMVANATRTFPMLSSSCNIPAAAKAYSLNFTSVPNVKLDFLTTWPAGQPQPLVSTLNAPTGRVTANAAIVPAGTNGDISVFVTQNSDLVIDINGYFAAPGPNGLALYTLPPCRVLDTRIPAGSQPFSGTRTVNVAGSNCNAPATAQAYVLNATVVPPGPLGFLTLWAQGATQPLVSTLNAGDGAITANMAIVPATNGMINAFASDPTQLVVDINGYFASVP